MIGHQGKSQWSLSWHFLFLPFPFPFPLPLPGPFGSPIRIPLSTLVNLPGHLMVLPPPVPLPMPESIGLNLPDWTASARFSWLNWGMPQCGGRRSEELSPASPSSVLPVVNVLVRLLLPLPPLVEYRFC